MKKLISLLLAVMLVMSMMTFSVMASTDTEITPKTAEEDLTLGYLGTTRVTGFYARTANTVEVAKESAESSNNIFKLKADYTGSATGSYLLAGYHSGIQDSQLTRLSAKINLPSVEGNAAITGVFVPERTYSVSPKEYTNAGVFLKNGGAYCYDRTLGAEQAFVPAGTMQANKWYRVEAIYDTRAMTADADTSKVYMNAFVFDGETNELVGTSGWRFVSVDTAYSGQKSYRMPIIQAYKYDEGSYVLIDDYKIYAISGSFDYTVEGEVETTIAPNKYIEVDPSGSFHKTVGFMFNTGNATAVLKDTTANKAARVEMDIRIPNLSENSQFDFFRLYSTAAGKQLPSLSTDNGEGFRVIDGTVQITGNALTVNAYDAATETYNTPVTLNVGTSYEIEEKEWYTLVWEMDYTNFESPVGMVYIKNDKGVTIAQTSTAYAIQPIPKNKWDQWTCVMVLGTGALKTEKYQFDNTNIYLADTVANLTNADARTVFIEDDFEDYEVGIQYQADIVGSEYGKTVVYPSEAAAVTIPTFEWEEGMELTSTDPLALTYTFTGPVPVSNITTNNIEFYANGVKLNSGYTIIPGTLDANNCVTTVTVNTGALDWDTSYIVRLKAEVADYNTALSGGIPAMIGLYEDTTFSVIAIKPDCEVEANIFNSDDIPYDSVTLTKDDVIKANISVTNNDEGQITCYGILAIYEGTKLVAAKKTELITISAGETVVNDSVTYTATKDGQTAKLFVWNNFELMTPWITPISLGQ